MIMKLSCLIAAAVYNIASTEATAQFRGSTAKNAATDAGCFHWNSQETTLFHPNDWTYCQPINQNMYMYYTPLEDTIMLGLHVLEGAHGWTALGQGGNGGMKGASQIVVRKNDDDKWVAEDRYSTDYAEPTVDDQQNVQLLFAEQDDVTGETAWGVLIPQNSCDDHDYAIEDRLIFMIFAVGSSHTFAYHGENRGQFTANLLNRPPSKPNMDEYDHVDLLMPNVPVVRDQGEIESGMDPSNAFVCTYYDMEILGKQAGFTSDDKVHMVGYEAVIEEGNESFLHHFVLFSCPMGSGAGSMAMGGGAALDDSHLFHQKVVSGCTTMPKGCESMLGGWAVGGAPVTYPHDVGVPIGEGQRWLVLQTHYYNPNMVEGVSDNSGLRVHLTTDLRPIDAGIMTFAAGVKTGQHKDIPGGMKDVTMETLYVEPDCTAQWSGPLQVFSVTHHSHFMGLHQEIVVERDGKNLGPIRTEHKFDYMHQSSVGPNAAVKTLLPGDRLAATCHFDTSSAPNSTVQVGEESNKEMCFPSIVYYPKQAVQNFAYAVPETYSKLYINNLEWCSQPSVNEDLFESQCAEQLYTNVPGFSSFFSKVLGYDGPDFDYPSLCNGGPLGAQIRNALPGVCPDNGCTETQSCSEEELLEHAKSVCERNCATIGLTLFPDLSRTEPYNTVNAKCPTPFFDAPTLAKPASCEVKGTLPRTIQLTLASEKVTIGDASKLTLEEDSGSASLVWNPFATVFMMIFGSFLI